MTPRELAGALRRCDGVFVWVTYESNDRAAELFGMFMRVPKATAHEIVVEAKAEKCEIDAHEKGGYVYIGNEP